MVKLYKSLFRATLAAAALAMVSASSAALADPPGRVARMSYIRGEVGFQPGGSGEWVDAVINRPLVAGDRLSTDRSSRVELEIGAGSIRIDERSAVSLLNIDDRITQIELSDGTLNLTVRRLLDGQVYEVDTPTLAFVVSQPGEYRVDVAPDGDSTMITVFSGNGDVYGDNDASYRVRDGQSYRFNDEGLRDYEVLDLPAADEFDRWCLERNGRYERATSTRYVSDEVVGYADLDDHGSWSNVDTYGSVWYPRGVANDWAPYRDGHWAWIDPWGWSWVDNQPWGFAPSHYGRWVQVSNRWGWVPGPRHLRPVYAPALVAFVGGNNWGVSIGSNPVGWFPLGPRDVYRPWYNCSQDYFTRVNLRNSRNFTNVTVINVYNDFSRGRPYGGNYTYRRDARAFTAVPGNVFAGARPVGRDRLRIGADAWGRGQIVNHVGIAPSRESLAARGNGRFQAPRGDRFDRRVIARNAPPAAVLPFDQRANLIRNNGNRPLRVDQMRGPGRAGENRTGNDNRGDNRVRVVDRDNRAQPRDLPGVGGRGQPNRDDRVGGNARPNPGSNDRRDAAERRDGRDAAGFNARGDDSRGGAAERRVGERRARDDNGQLRSSRFAPGQRDRQQDDRREVGNPGAREQSGSDDRQQRRAEPDQQREVRDAAREQQRAAAGRQRDMDSEREQARQQREVGADQQRNQRAAMQEQQRDQGAQREQARQQRQVADDQQRNQRAAMQEQQRAAAADRQRDQGAQREQARQQRQVADEQQRNQRAAMQEQRRSQMEQQRSQQNERMQVQQQQREQQAGRFEAQQQQREQQQQQRQAQAQQQQLQRQAQQQQQQQAQPQQGEQRQPRGNRRERDDKQD